MDSISSEVKTVGLKARAVKGASINVLGQFVAFVCQTVGVVILARLLGPRDFGLVAMVSVFSLWLMNFGINGFTEYIVQKKQIDEEEVNSIFWLHILLATLLASSFLPFGSILVYFYDEPLLSGIAAAMASSIVFVALSTSHMAILNRDMRFGAIAATHVIAVLVSTVLAIAAALGSMGYWAIVIRQLTIPFISLIAAWVLCPWRPSRPKDLLQGLPGLKYAVQVYCNFSLGYFSRSIDTVLIGRFHGPRVLGIYDRAYYFSTMPAGQLLTPLHSVALATLSRLREDEKRFTAYFTKAVSIVAFFGALVALLMTITANDLIPLLLGPEWTESAQVVMAFGPGIASMLVYGTHSWLHLSLGTPNRWLRWNVLSTLLTATIFIIAAPYGPVAMAIAYSGKTLALLLPALWYAGRPIQLSMAHLLPAIWSYFASAAAVYIFWLFISQCWWPLSNLLAEMASLYRIVLISCIAPLLYISLVCMLQRSTQALNEISALIQLIITRREVKTTL